MATATRIKQVTLTMNGDEAEALTTLLYWHVAGDSVYRGLLIDNILKTMRRAGVDYDKPYRDENNDRCPVIMISKEGMGR